MHYHRRPTRWLLLLVTVLLLACNGHKDEKKAEKEIVSNPESIDAVVQKNIKAQLSSATEHNWKFDDSTSVASTAVLKTFYEANENVPFWSSMEKWNPYANELLAYIEGCSADGLYKEAYHFSSIHSLKEILDADSLKRMDAVLWTKADILLSNAFINIMQDLKQGRLQPDSMCWMNDPTRYKSFFAKQFERLKAGEPFDSIAKSVQPKLRGYWALKNEVQKFTDSMDYKKYSYITYPYKTGDKADSIAFVKKLLMRLGESGISDKNNQPDSLQLSALIKKYQQHKKINADGKINTTLIRLLNNTDIVKYNRIAITLDRYKQLPDSMPPKYILVNLPGFYLQVWDSDTIAFTSKIICGKPATATPFITSAISDIVIFPTWTVPTSIIKKEMLPGLKRSASYLARKGLNLYNSKGELVDPTTVNWAKYSKGIPFKIQQGSGDNNALGVIKFNFNNPFDVYLHDTNQRYLFKNSMRALSHGCVRVQDWEKLAFYIARNDSLQSLNSSDTLRYNTDSISNWIAQKERHRIDVKHKIPLFIRYFGCEGMNGSIKFYDDIYDEDKKLKEKFFSLR